MLIADRESRVTPIVESLVEKSLVRRVPAEDHSRFDLLEPVRAFAAGRVSDEMPEGTYSYWTINDDGAESAQIAFRIRQGEKTYQRDSAALGTEVGEESERFTFVK